MHLNISSLQYHFNEFSELLNDLTIKFKIIGITESRLRPEKSSLTDINLPNYNIKHMPRFELSLCTLQIAMWILVIAIVQFKSYQKCKAVLFRRKIYFIQITFFKIISTFYSSILLIPKTKSQNAKKCFAILKKEHSPARG